MIRRAQEITKGGYWCFPGGHVERGETPRQAIRREFVEELGIEVTPTERLGAIRLPDLGYVLAVWRVRHIAGSLRLAEAEIAEARWLSAEGIRVISPSLPSNGQVLEMLGE